VNYLLFILFVVIVGGVLLVSLIFAHAPVRRYTAGWWGGNHTGLFVIAASQPYFQDLPTHIVSSGCSVGVRLIGMLLYLMRQM